MQYRPLRDEVEISDVQDFDLTKIFECGQCFRWNAQPDGSYTGVAMDHAARIRKDNDRIFISGSIDEFEKIWLDYFDLNRNYAEIRASLCIDDYMKTASDFGAGIRILNQDKWEALCSFIISQCNNIPRIKKIIETLCRCFGDQIFFEGIRYYTFPPAERIAALQEEDLAPLRCGYRAPYVINAAKAVSTGELDLEKLARDDFNSAINSLKKLKGVGDKVANCVVLFGLHMLNAFPVDVWMKKVLRKYYSKDFNPDIFGEYAGIAQQYMFYYARSGGDNFV